MCKSYCANNCHINVLCELNTCNIRWGRIDTKEQNTTAHSYFTSQVSVRGKPQAQTHKPGEKMQLINIHTAELWLVLCL
jgi:hypothetical protein